MLISDFINNEFKAFSSHDNVRSIPSIIDGFKEAQRKAVYGMFSHGNSEIKVAQLSGSASLVTHYEHGESSMADTIVGLAQDYPGSNNINLFEPIGQFGSILSSGASAHRYIFTKPSKYLRKMIRGEDDCILEYNYEDGDQIEPINYFPVLPLWLINGVIGIGTGHSVKILPRDPQNVSEMINKIVSGINVQQKTIDRLLMPAFNGWTGTVKAREGGGYTLVGRLEKLNTSTLRVTELPVGYGIDKFKAILVDLMEKGKVKDFDNNSSESGFDVTIKVPREVGKKPESDLLSLFKLVSNVGENITLWDISGKLRNYDSVYDALLEFVEFRLTKYNTRKEVRTGLIDEEIAFLNEKSIFIKEWNEFENAGKMSEDKIERHMIQKGVSKETFPRLMAMKVSSLSLDQIKALSQVVDTKKKERAVLAGKLASTMYIEDLAGL